MAAPASAAPSALSAISSGVTGRCGDIDGVWIAPVTAQVMMTFAFAAMCRTRFPLQIRSAPDFSVRAPLMRRERHQAAIAPGLPLDEAIGRQSGAAISLDRIENRAAPIGAPLHALENVGIDRLVALDVIAHAGRRIEVDGLERADEGPAQGQA